jgi:5'-nucleotidase/UDP-sugar diphosphatase
MYFTYSKLNLAAMLLLVALFIGCGKPEISEGTRITIVYSNDTHGKLEGCGCKHNSGGILKRSHRVKTIRTNDSQMLYCDAGNFLFGSSEANATQGKAQVAALNELQASIVNVSEEELEKGLDVFNQRKNEARFDFISANIEANGKPLTSPYIMKQIKGLDVAFVGLCAPTNIMRSDSAKLPPGVHVRNQMTEAQKVIPRLGKKADLLIVLSTCGDALDSALAKNFPMIDLIIGGRTFRSNAEDPWKIGNTSIVRAKRNGCVLGRVEFEFSLDRQIKSVITFEETLDMDTPSDESMLAVVQKYLPDFTDSAKD